MKLGKMEAIFDWERGRISAPQEWQKNPWILTDALPTVIRSLAHIRFHGKGILMTTSFLQIDFYYLKPLIQSPVQRIQTDWIDGLEIGV